jgi:hypothetical protein
MDLTTVYQEIQKKETSRLCLRMEVSQAPWSILAMYPLHAHSILVNSLYMQHVQYCTRNGGAVAQPP